MLFATDLCCGVWMVRHIRNFTLLGNKEVVGLEIRPIPHSKHYEIWFIGNKGNKRIGYNGISFMKSDVEDRLESIGRLNTITEIYD